MKINSAPLTDHALTHPHESARRIHSNYPLVNVQSLRVPMAISEPRINHVSHATNPVKLAKVLNYASHVTQIAFYCTTLKIAAKETVGLDLLSLRLSTC